MNHTGIQVVSTLRALPMPYSRLLYNINQEYHASIIVPHEGIGKLLRCGSEALARALCTTYEILYRDIATNSESLYAFTDPSTRDNFINELLAENEVTSEILLDDRCTLCSQTGCLCPTCTDVLNYAKEFEMICYEIAHSVVWDVKIQNIYATGKVVYIEVISPTHILIKEAY